MTDQIEEPIFHVQGWDIKRIAIAVTRSYSCMIRGARLPSTLWDRYPYWQLGSGLVLAQ